MSRIGLLQGFASDQKGTVAVMAVILAPVMLIASGAALDFTRRYSAESWAQRNLDTALIAAVSEIGSDDKAKISAKLTAWFKSQRQPGDGSFELGDINVDLNEATVTATSKAASQRRSQVLLASTTSRSRSTAAQKAGTAPISM